MLMAQCIDDQNDLGEHSVPYLHRCFLPRLEDSSALRTSGDKLADVSQRVAEDVQNQPPLDLLWESSE